MFFELVQIRYIYQITNWNKYRIKLINHKFKSINWILIIYSFVCVLMQEKIELIVLVKKIL